MKELAAGGKVTGQIIKEAYEKGDAMATEALDQIGEYLGLLYFNLYQILNINCYVIGGGLTNFGEALFSRIEKNPLIASTSNAPKNSPSTLGRLLSPKTPEFTAPRCCLRSSKHIKEPMQKHRLFLFLKGAQSAKRNLP